MAQKVNDPDSVPVVSNRPATTATLDVLLARLRSENPDLAKVLIPEVEHLRESRKFGLVFNRHLPESVKLPDHPITAGVRVAVRNPRAVVSRQGLTGKAAAAAVETLERGEWVVTRLAGSGNARVAYLEPTSDATAEWDGPAAVRDLVVVRQFGEPVYPGLRPVADRENLPSRIANGQPTDPWHLVINGENHHALQALKFTHQGKVDLIYIDPPYNTGNKSWIYNDKYVDTAKGDSSSKWLSFMEKRLKAAYDLLKDTGVIIVAIGDEEHHRLRMLMDQVFKPENFISDVVWQGSRKMDARYVSNGADYMLIYARDGVALGSSGDRWSDAKPGVDEVLAAAGRCWEASAQSADDATVAFKTWWKAAGKGHPAYPSRHYSFIDEQGRVYAKVDMSRSSGARPNLMYPIHHPVTGEEIPPPQFGWAVNRDEMQRRIEAGLVSFGPDGRTMPRTKQFLTESSYERPASVFESRRLKGVNHVERIFGDKRFPFPKDHEVLMRWFRMAAPKDAVILDFFGGSGSTAEAVMRLNAEDGGSRQSILVTNNELSAADAARLTKEGKAPGDPEWEARGVFEYVTRPRLTTVVTGTREDGSTYSDGLAANVAFFNLAYLDESRVSRAKEFEAIAPLLWMQAGARGDMIGTESRLDDGGAGYEVSRTGGYAVLFDTDAIAGLLRELASDSSDGTPDVDQIFVVTDSIADYERVCSRLPATATTHMLYEAYLTNFEINTGGVA